jgi:hypothetical protein
MSSNVFNQDNIVLNILSFCDYSNNLRINKRFSCLVNMTFYHDKFIEYCKNKSVDEVKNVIHNVNSETVCIVFLESFDWYNTYPLRQYLFHHEKFDYTYNDYQILFKCCKVRFSSTLILLLRYEYSDHVIQECYNILCCYNEDHRFDDVMLRELLFKYGHLITLENVKNLYKRVTKSRLNNLLQKYKVNDEIIQFINS